METISYLVFIYGLLTWKFFITVHGVNAGCPNKTDIAIEWETEIPYNVHSLYRGEWWKLDCRVKKYVNVTARLWQRRSGSIKEILVDGGKLKNDGNIFNLTDISSSDEGYYYCTVCGVKKPARKGREMELKLYIKGKPFQYPYVRVESKSNTGTIEFGDDVKMICYINGDYNPNWYKGKKWRPDAELFFQGKYENYTLLLSLEIKNFKKSDEGLYICRVNRKVVNWIAEKKVNLTMKARTKPTFVNFPKGIKTVKAGKVFSVTIVSDGSPKPRAYCNLERSGSKIEEGKHFNNMDSSVNISIETLSYFRDNEALFMCNATNSNGFTVENFSLNVQVKPKIKRDGNAHLKVEALEQSLNLTCEIEEANPTAQINWTYSYTNDENHIWLPVPLVDINSGSITLTSQSTTQKFYRCVANNSLGNDKFTWLVHHAAAITATKPDQDKNVSPYMISIILVSTIIAFVLLLIVVVLYKRNKLYGGFYIFTLPPALDYIKTLDKSKSLHEQSHKLPYLPEWEFPRENITLLNELGSGAFGLVYLVNAIGISSFRPRILLSEKKAQRRFSLSRFQRRNVYVLDKIIKQTAVKTLKENYDQAALADIQSEIRILIHIGEHENILNILGACTKGNDKPLIILEYCPHGNLRDFLRSRRDIYTPEWKKIDNTQLSITDVVNFALQVSEGMTFLISRKCIHRDLAARNVLVGEGYVAKISDFGMARDVYESLDYIKQSSGLLPLKWMAIESIKDRIFNEKTDVWSFGILLWEMFTLGGMPYPNLQLSEVFESLINGHRMSAPICCPEEMADIMMICWCENPDERPQFSTLSDMFEKLCSKKTIKTDEYQNIPCDIADEDALELNHAF